MVGPASTREPAVDQASKIADEVLEFVESRRADQLAASLNIAGRSAWKWRALAARPTCSCSTKCWQV
jgi:hypothetical protein